MAGATYVLYAFSNGTAGDGPVRGNASPTAQPPVKSRRRATMPYVLGRIDSRNRGVIDKCRHQISCLPPAHDDQKRSAKDVPSGRTSAKIDDDAVGALSTPAPEILATPCWRASHFQICNNARKFGDWNIGEDGVPCTISFEFSRHCIVVS